MTQIEFFTIAYYREKKKSSRFIQNKIDNPTSTAKENYISMKDIMGLDYVRDYTYKHLNPIEKGQFCDQYFYKPKT